MIDKTRSKEDVQSGGTYGALHLDGEVTPGAHSLFESRQSDESALCKGGSGEEEEGEEGLKHVHEGRSG